MTTLDRIAHVAAMIRSDVYLERTNSKYRSKLLMVRVRRLCHLVDRLRAEHTLSLPKQGEKGRVIGAIGG